MGISFDPTHHNIEDGIAMSTPEVKTRAAYPTTVIRLIKAWRDMMQALMMSISMANMMRNVIGGIRIMPMVWMMPWVNWMSGGRLKH